MKTLRGILVTATIAAASSGAMASPAPVVDQSFNPGDTTVMAFITQSHLGQSFRQLADNIAGAGLLLTGPSSASADIRIELWADKPTAGGAPLRSGQASGVGGSWVDVFWDVQSVEPERTYFLTFTTSSGESNGLGLAGSTNGTYLRGRLYAGSTGGAIFADNPAFDNFDFSFRTFAAAAPVPEPAGWASLLGGLALIGAARARRRLPGRA